MANDMLEDDDYVANLLKKDAKATAKKYEMVGLDAFLPNRTQVSAPKPNTRFLRHIIRETDSHNAALLAREAEESRARLKRLNREKDRRTVEADRLTPPDFSDSETKVDKRKRKTSDEDDHGGYYERRQRRFHAESTVSRSKRSREHERSRRDDRRRVKEREDEDAQSERLPSSTTKRGKNRRREHSSDRDHDRSRRRDASNGRHRRRRSRSRSPTRSPSPRRSQKHHKLVRRSRSSQSPMHRSRSPRPPLNRRSNGAEADGRRSSLPRPGSDSDPLEAIVGPLPLQSQPTVRPRGRGAHKANSMAIDARFSSTYDPSADVHLHSDDEDDWGDALEALKDRQRWKQQGAERLKAAGFSDEQVKKWGKGDEKTEEDVTWSGRGQGREWDRGKVLDGDGNVDLKADWGRLK